MAAVTAAETCEGNGLKESIDTEIADAPTTAAVTADSLPQPDETSAGSPEGSVIGGPTGTVHHPPGTDLDGIGMPQWKRDLIQRRKTNIARTIGANQMTACSKKASDVATSPTMPLTKTPGGSGVSPNSNSSSHSQSPRSVHTVPPTGHHQSQLHGSGTGQYSPLNGSCGQQPPQALAAESTSQEDQLPCIATKPIRGSSDCNTSEAKRESAPLVEQASSNSKCAGGGTSGTCLTTSSKQPYQPQQLQPDSAELQQPFQLHSRHDIERSPPSCSVASSVSNSPPSSCLFVKNPSAIKACKTNKYKTTTAKSSVPGCLNSAPVNAKKMVAAQDISETANIDFDFDPSEELQYGPGIVSKLRCRYLSLALRQSAGKQRPPLDSLRRATSLNNLLDDDEDSNSSCVVDHGDNQGQKGGWSSPVVAANSQATRNPDEFVATFQKSLKLSERDKRSRQIKRGNDSLKRARSVEALLGCDKSWDGEHISNGVLPVKQVLKRIGPPKDVEENGIGEILVQEQPAEITIEDKITNARERITLNEKPPKRLTSIIDDTERPPPDLVKQTLKMFEATAHRRGRGLSRNNFSGEVAAKVASYKSIISQEKPPIVFPKPPLSPRKHFRKPGSLDIAGAKKSGQQATAATKRAHPISPVSNMAKKFTSCEMNVSTESSDYTPPSSQSSSPTILIAGHRAPRNSFDTGNSTRAPDVVPRRCLEMTANVDFASPSIQLAKMMERLTINSPLTNISADSAQPHIPQQNNSESDSDSITLADSSGGDALLKKRVSKVALENISNAGTTQTFSFGKSNSGRPAISLSPVNGNSATDSGPNSDVHQVTSPTVKQVGVIRPIVSESRLQTEKPKPGDIDFPVDEISANTRDNLVITNLSHTNSSSRASPQSSEKPALTSREIEKNLINEKKNEQASLESAAVKWQVGKKKPWSSQIAPSQNNCMVFNFKDRKEVPDYIENDGLIFKRRRELPKPNESGFVLLGDLTLETSTDPDESWAMGPPSPCDVEFENANIIIDGKSSIRYRSREVSLRVKFDDSLTSTFEYPSEISLLDDSFSGEHSTNKDSMDHITVEEIIQIPSSKLLGNVSLDCQKDGGSYSAMCLLPAAKRNLDTKKTIRNYANTPSARPTTSSKPITSNTANPNIIQSVNVEMKPPKRMKPLTQIRSLPVGTEAFV